MTIYGTDNGIDGIVLDVLLRKHEQIRKALGISVPEVRASLGTSAEVAAFTEEALRSLQADVTIMQKDLRVATVALPPSLRARLVPGHAEPLTFYRLADPAPDRLPGPYRP